MRQKGFATIFGLCMILVIALCVKGIQESEMNFSYETADFQAEFELQNAAISGVYEAAEKVRDNKELLPEEYSFKDYERKNHQPLLVNKTITYSDEKKHLKEIYLKVWGERLNDLRIYNVKKYTPQKEKKLIESDVKGYILFSVAESSNERVDGKIYRSVLAYVRSENQTDGTNITFMEPFE